MVAGHKIQLRARVETSSQIKSVTSGQLWEPDLVGAIGMLSEFGCLHQI